MERSGGKHSDIAQAGRHVGLAGGVPTASAVKLAVLPRSPASQEAMALNPGSRRTLWRP